MNQYFVYILASKKNGTLYTGVTNDLKKRVYEDKHDLIEGFTKKYRVYFEETNDVYEALTREKHMKKWKIGLIEKNSPNWNDLYEDIG